MSQTLVRTLVLTWLPIVLVILDAALAKGRAGGGRGGAGARNPRDSRVGGGGLYVSRTRPPDVDRRHPPVAYPFVLGVILYPRDDGAMPYPGDAECVTAATEQCSTITPNVSAYSQSSTPAPSATFRIPSKCCDGM